jgi:hypothetical protein
MPGRWSGRECETSRMGENAQMAFKGLARNNKTYSKTFLEIVHSLS